MRYALIYPIMRPGQPPVLAGDAVSRWVMAHGKEVPSSLWHRKTTARDPFRGGPAGCGPFSLIVHGTIGNPQARLFDCRP